jgi:hypothetical protein
VADETMRVLGAKPVWFPVMGPIDEFDGIEQQTASIAGNGYDGIVKHFIANVNLWPRPLVIFTSRKTFDSLSLAQRNALRQAVANVQRPQTAFQRRTEQEAAGNLCRRGLTFETAGRDDLATLRRAVQPVYADLERDPTTRKAIGAIERLKRDSPVSPDAPPSCQGAGQEISGDPTPVDGVYEMTTDRSAAAPEFYAENWGRWIFVFDRGRFAITQENRDACTWGHGQYSVKGREMTWTFTDGGGIAPTGALNRAGELFVFGWSRYRDTLSLTPVEGAVSPENFRAEPWHRISATPSPRYFAKRCPPPGNALRR